MRIISKFHDYYDAALGYGVDNSCVYIRKTEELKGKYNVNDQDPRRILILQAIEDAFQKLNGRLPERFRYVAVGFCGKIYIGLAYDCMDDNSKMPAENPRDWRKTYPTNFAWALDDIDATWHDKPLRERSYFGGYYANDLRDWFKRNENNLVHECVDLFAENHIVCFGYDRNDVFIDPRLTDYKFQRRLDAFTTFQEINMFVAGVLAQTDNVPDLTTDADRIVAKGFNERSFRKDPTKHFR